MRPISPHALQLLVDETVARSRPGAGADERRRRRSAGRIITVLALTGVILLALATPLVAVAAG
jgi:hypothetical protein